MTVSAWVCPLPGRATRLRPPRHVRRPLRRHRPRPRPDHGPHPAARQPPPGAGCSPGGRRGQRPQAHVLDAFLTASRGGDSKALLAFSAPTRSRVPTAARSCRVSCGAARRGRRGVASDQLRLLRGERACGTGQRHARRCLVRRGPTCIGLVDQRPGQPSPGPTSSPIPTTRPRPTTLDHPRIAPVSRRTLSTRTRPTTHSAEPLPVPYDGHPGPDPLSCGPQAAAGRSRSSRPAVTATAAAVSPWTPKAVAAGPPSVSTITMSPAGTTAMAAIASPSALR